jgi:hypothetical protein
MIAHRNLSSISFQRAATFNKDRDDLDRNLSFFNVVFYRLHISIISVQVTYL